MSAADATAAMPRPAEAAEGEPTNRGSVPLSGKQRRKASMNFEEAALCAICQDGEWEDDDQIIFCDQCNMPVHQACYGSGANCIPDGPWYCDPCSHGRRTGNKQLQECVLCPIKGGALKRTSDFRWAHIVCGLWIPEAEFLVCLARLPKTRCLHAPRPPFAHARAFPAAFLRIRTGATL
jgi:NuA3 HAT complex component NTO1